MAPYACDYYVRPVNGNDGWAGTSYAAAFATLQKALDTATAGKTIGLCAEAEEVLTAAVDDDTNSGSSTGGLIKKIGLNAAGERDGTRYALNGNSTAANCVLCTKTFGKWINVQFKNATGDGFSQATTLGHNFFENCLFNNNGAEGYDNNIINSLTCFYKCQIYSNTNNGVGVTASNTQQIFGCSIFLNGGIGIVNGAGTSLLLKNLICKNTGNGISSTTGTITVIGNTIDGNAKGINATTGILRVLFNRITNNTTNAIAITSGLVVEDYNYYFNNGTKFSVTTGKIDSGAGSVDMAAAGYVNQPANNYALVNGATPAEGRFLAYVLDSTNTDYSSIGIEPNPDFSAVAFTRAPDTTDGVVGTQAALATDADYLALEMVRNKFNAGSSVADLLLTKSVKLLNVDNNGTNAGAVAPDKPTGLEVTAIMTTSFTLSWDGMPRATSYDVYKGGVLYENVTTTHSHITGLTAATAYSMTVIAKNGAGDSAATSPYSITTAAVLDILTACEARMVTDIEAMTTANGYNYNWGNCNEKDMAKKEAATTADIFAMEEKNIDGKDGTDANSYSNDKPYEIHVFVPLATLTDNPEFSSRAGFNKALDDLKRCFALDFHLNENCIGFKYAGEKKDFNKTGDVTIPGKMITRWMLSYSQDRTTPSLPCN